MKVKLIKTGEVKEYGDSYAARLIEQGKAVPLPAQKKPARKAAAKVDGDA